MNRYFQEIKNASDSLSAPSKAIVVISITIFSRLVMDLFYLFIKVITK